jgi:dimethylhistidine N-methyltransferase
MDTGFACQFQTQPALCEEILAGLEQAQKRLPSKLFYDETGSRLFDAICDLPEYYLTRTEMQIMERHAAPICQALGSHVRLVEFGSGSSSKTELLLGQLRHASYVPVDISREHLLRTAQRLRQRFPQQSIHPLVADFTEPLRLPPTLPPARSTLVYFPGSTLGNFELREARLLLRRFRSVAGDGGSLLIGVDLRKDANVLEAAYNDSAGVTAAFNLNLLDRLNREFDADFEPARFVHRAHYDAEQGRIEMHLCSRAQQRFSILGRSFGLAPGETLHTENSYKYSAQMLELMARASGFRIEAQWTDPRQYFAVQWWAAI